MTQVKRVERMTRDTILNDDKLRVWTVLNNTGTVIAMVAEDKLTGSFKVRALAPELSNLEIVELFAIAEDN